MTDTLQVKFDLLEARKELAKARKTIESQADLLNRWNKAASHAGICGSEYINDPERVFERVIANRTSLHSMLRKAEVTR